MLLLIAVLVALALAGPASAADRTVDVTDFTFTPGVTKVDVGDTVVWDFVNGGHTTTSDPGQAESWDSGYPLQGATYAHIFTRPGRFTYVCTPHAGLGMVGTIQVGDDSASATLARFSAKHIGRRITVSFRLNEAARVRYRLRGPTRRTIKRGRLRAGSHRITVRRLARGRYRGALTVVDDFGHRAVRRNRFRVG